MTAQISEDLLLCLRQRARMRVVLQHVSWIVLQRICQAHGDAKFLWARQSRAEPQPEPEPVQSLTDWQPWGTQGQPCFCAFFLSADLQLSLNLSRYLPQPVRSLINSFVKVPKWNLVELHVIICPSVCVSWST